MKISSLLTLLVFLAISLSAEAQIPTNDDKEFEYHAESSVRRAGSGDLVKRFAHWGKQYFSDDAQVKVLVDDSTERYVEVYVTEPLVESHFGVNRVHKERSLSYHIKFDSDRKNYQYWINDFHYKAREIDHKNRETMYDEALSEVRGAASKSLEEEVHNRMTDMIASFEKAAETELEE